MRAAALQMTAAATVAVDAVNVEGVPCEWIRPVGCDGRVLLYFHGGGYAVGGLDTHRQLVGHLAEAAGLVALSVGYRLAPEHPYPAAVDDAVRVLEWLLAEGVAAEDVAVGGDSAGGGLALATCIVARERGWAMPGGMVLLSPWVDMAAAEDAAGDDAVGDPIVSRANLRELRDWYLADTDHAPYASPLRAELAGLPRTLIQVGGRELLRADAIELGQRLCAAGVDATCQVWDHMVHVWQLYAGVAPEADAAVAAIGEWLRRR